jgi:hypothetical protein
VLVYSACPRGRSTCVLVSYWPYQAPPAGRLAPVWRCGALPPQTSADRLHLCYQASRSDTVLSRLRNDPRVTAAERVWEALRSARAVLTSAGRPPGVAWTRGRRELFWLVASAHELGSDPT